MKQPLLLLAIITSLLCFAIFISDVYASKYTSGADLTNPVSGRITSDTTWTKANSPYQLEDNVYVDPGVTLTLEPGVRIESWASGIQVEGALIAKGTSTDKIVYDGGFYFTEIADAWNQETGTGCILENCQMTGVVSKVAVKINECNFTSGKVCGDSIVSNNIIRGDLSVNGSVIVWKNTIMGEVKNEIAGTPDNFPIISANSFSVTGQRYYGKSAINCRGYVWVIDNTISHCYWGICITAGWDELDNFVWPNARVERNLITDCWEGIVVESPAIAINSTTNPTIVNNEISQNKWGIHVTREARQLMIMGNNIVGNSNYSIYGESRYDLNAQGNWWGTTDESTIDRSIFDKKHTPHLGTVSFTPFLMEHNTQAMPDLNAPMPIASSVIWTTITPTLNPTSNAKPNETSTSTDTPTATDTPIQSPNQSGSESAVSGKVNDLQTGYLVTLTLVVILLVVLFALVLKEQIHKKVQ